MWQDLFFTSSGITFSVMLIPQLIDAYNGKGMNVITASLTAGILFIQCYAYFTLNMIYAAIPITAIVWTLIAYLSINRDVISPYFVLRGKQLPKHLEELERLSFQSMISELQSIQEYTGFLQSEIDEEDRKI
jgi:hypothetical protein